MKTKKVTRSYYQQQLRKKNKKRLKPLPFWILILFFSSVFLFSLYKLIVWEMDNRKIDHIESDIEEMIDPELIDDEGELINPPEDKNSDYWYYVNLPFYDVDFSKLLKKNKDTVAFIHVNDTNINYPVVQTKDNNYYLNHAFDKSVNDAGWVFLDYRNNIHALSENTIIYGHGRLNKTVFGSLKDTLSKEWQKKKENYAIFISTPQENMVFQIFSIYTIDSESYYITSAFESSKAKQDWLSTMKKRNTSSINTEVNVQDKILTLSTCSNNYGGRIVVQAKLIKRQEK